MKYNKEMYDKIQKVIKDKSPEEKLLFIEEKEFMQDMIDVWGKEDWELNSTLSFIKNEILKGVEKCKKKK